MINLLRRLLMTSDKTWGRLLWYKLHSWTLTSLTFSLSSLFHVLWISSVSLDAFPYDLMYRISCNGKIHSSSYKMRLLWMGKSVHNLFHKEPTSAVILQYDVYIGGFHSPKTVGILVGKKLQKFYVSSYDIVINTHTIQHHLT